MRTFTVKIAFGTDSDKNQKISEKAKTIAVSIAVILGLIISVSYL